jgi:hypothetical protein
MISQRLPSQWVTLAVSRLSQRAMHEISDSSDPQEKALVTAPFFLPAINRVSFFLSHGLTCIIEVKSSIS